MPNRWAELFEYHFLRSPFFITKELKKVVLSMKNKGAPKSKGIAANVYKLVFQHRPDVLLRAFKVYLKRGILTCRWKEVLKGN